MCRRYKGENRSLEPVQAREEAMFLPKSDVFKDLTQEAINEISEIAQEESYEQGTTLFATNDPANHFYILIEGRVRLAIGVKNRTEYLVKNLGEAFGWSSVVGNDRYTAEAQCIAPTKVLKIDKADLERVFDEHERSGRKFYMRLARALGQRLMDMHE